MRLTVLQGQIQQAQVDTLVVNLFEGVTSPAGATGAVDRALSGAISELIASGDFRGKLGEVGIIYPRGAIPAQRVLVVGLGIAERVDLESIRRASATALKRARELNAKDVATIVHGAGFGGLKVQAAAQATTEGALLGLYRFAAPKKSDEPAREIQSLTFIEIDGNKLAEVQAGVTMAEAVCTSVFLARDLVNLPPSIATPSKMASVAQEIAATYGMRVIIGDRDWANQQKMGSFLGVAKGASEPPKFIILEHNIESTDLDTIVLVGKGITFDSGGISLKPSERMEEMKSDMAGAATVLATMQVVGKLNLPLRVIGITPCTENMPDGGAYHPADILTASNGKTIEVISTDAEGRLVLADALVYAGRYKPRAVVDLATLTGACVVALGEQIAAGLFCNDDGLRDKLLTSSQATFERVWPMPLFEDYRKKIDSKVADLRNSGGRNGGVGASAMFLKEFTDYPWAHLDIAGMALVSEKRDETPYVMLGPTGYGVRLLVDFLRNWK
jgi:leucyl aminopeptidase